MKKALIRSLIVFGIFVLWASTNRTAMQWISAHRDNPGWWGAYEGRHGDLLGIAHLDMVPRFREVTTPVAYSKPIDTGTKDIALFLHGDSYTRHMKDSFFTGIAAYHFIDRNMGAVYHLDTLHQRNVLVIEISERYFRGYFRDLGMKGQVHDSGMMPRRVGSLDMNDVPESRVVMAGMPLLSMDNLFNKYINQNLQYNLFNYNFAMPLFESKAALNFYLFNRASGDVVISDDRRFLFLRETVEPTGDASSFSSLGQEEVDTLVSHLNILYDHYRAEGFREVYLSIIPNSATINQPTGYNMLIPRIQNHSGLRMKVIDVYGRFKNSSKVLYWSNDTHWNYAGVQVWLDAVNERLMGIGE